MGKFVGQTLWDGPLGTKIKATSFRFYSPAGQWFGDGNKHRVGITPTIQVEQSQSVRLYSGADAQLNAAVKALHSQ
jgi:C-terminal processing protease CtpA/Prc